MKAEFKSPFLGWIKLNFGLRVWLEVWAGKGGLTLALLCTCCVALGSFRPHVLISPLENGGRISFFSPRGCGSELTKRQNLWQSLSERSLTQRRFDPHKPGSLNILPSLHVQATKFQTWFQACKQIFLGNLELPTGMFLRCSSWRDFTLKAFHFGLCLALNTGLYLDLLFYFLAYSWGPKESEQILSVFPGVEEVWKNKVSACRLFLGWF